MHCASETCDPRGRHHAVRHASKLSDGHGPSMASTILPTYLTLPHLTLPHLTSPYLTLLYLTLPYTTLTLHYPLLTCTLPSHAPYFTCTLPSHARYSHIHFTLIYTLLSHARYPHMLICTLPSHAPYKPSHGHAPYMHFIMFYPHMYCSISRVCVCMRARGPSVYQALRV